jgi:predicted amidohydrolase YtcJ
MSSQLFINGVIYTLQADQPLVTSVFVKEGKIYDIGDSHQLLAKYSGVDVEVIDFEGKMVLPGLTDSHMHLIAHGMKLLSLDFSACTDALQMKQMLQDKINQTPKGEWVLGVGWNENNFSDRKIFTKEELDECSSGHPILLTRVCGHASISNSLALSIAGISDSTEDPSGGKIMRDDRGNVTGLLLENAGQLVQEHIPAHTYVFLQESLKKAIKDCWRLGLVGCHSEDLRYSGGFNQTFQLFDNVLHKQQYTFRVNQLVYHDYMDEIIASGKGYGSGTSLFTVGAMKIFTDGAMGGRSALLSESYSDAPGINGVAMYTPEELLRIVKKAREYKFPVAVHTIGDLALEYILDAIEALPALDSQLDRIIHAQVLRHDLLERMTKLPIVVDIQPRFVAADFPWVIERLGEERTRWSYAWKTLLHAGIACAGGSDAPIEPVNPLLGIHAAVTRIRPEEEEHDGYLPEQRLSIQEAIHLFTTGSAFAEQKSAQKGTIEIGKVADFTVLEKDLYQTSPASWLENKVSMTVIGGQVVYRG